jgi:hypothetical protein
MSREMTECSNPKCECLTAASIDPSAGEPGEAYCGDYCRDAEASEEQDNCACGHPACDSP